MKYMHLLCPAAHAKVAVTFVYAVHALHSVMQVTVDDIGDSLKAASPMNLPQDAESLAQTLGPHLCGNASGQWL
jgi:hypothetical protein